jgi:hypothetical protein
MMLFHHSIALFASSGSIYFGTFFCTLGTACYFTELAAILVNVSMLIERHGLKESIYYKVVGGITVLAIFITRVCY